MKRSFESFIDRIQCTGDSDVLDHEGEKVAGLRNVELNEVDDIPLHDE